jgi:hypothetical protein
MTRTELLDAALKKLEQVVKLLDRAREEVLADRSKPTNPDITAHRLSQAF